jgi:hypothetical protein
MFVPWFSWGSPVGLAFFLAGTGVFFWGLFSGLAKLNAAKQAPHADKRDGQA